MPLGLRVRWSSEAPFTGSGKARRASDVKEMSKVLSGNLRSMPFMISVSTVTPLEVHSGWEAIKARLAEMKSALRSTAEMWRAEWELMALLLRHWVVSTAGPQALSRMRRGRVGGGR